MKKLIVTILVAASIIAVTTPTKQADAQYAYCGSCCDINPYTGGPRIRCYLTNPYACGATCYCPGIAGSGFTCY